MHDVGILATAIYMPKTSFKDIRPHYQRILSYILCICSLWSTLSTLHLRAFMSVHILWGHVYLYTAFQCYRMLFTFPIFVGVTASFEITCFTIPCAHSNIYFTCCQSWMNYLHHVHICPTYDCIYFKNKHFTINYE